MNSLFLQLLVLLQIFCCSIAHCQHSTELYDKKTETLPFQSRQIITFQKKPLSGSLCLVSQNSKYGIIDSTGEMVVPMIYDQINVNFTTREGLVWERKYLPENELFYFFWEDGNESEELYRQLLKQEMANPVSPYNLESAFRLKPFFAAKKENVWGVINATNEVLIPFEYDFIEEIGQDILLAKKHHSFELLTPDNRKIITSCDTIIVPPIARYIPLGSEFAVYAILMRDHKYGAINLLNMEMILPRYDDIEYCSYLYEDTWLCAFNPYDIWANDTIEQFNRTHPYGNVIKYKSGNKVGLLDLLCMQEITPASFDRIRIFNKYRTRGQIVQLDSLYTYLTHNNTRLHDGLYDSVSRLCGSDFYYRVSLNGKTGVYDDLGKKVVDLKWEDIQLFHSYSSYISYTSFPPYFIVKRNGKYGVIDSHEKNVLPMQYDSITFKYENHHYVLELRRKEKLKTIYLEDL